MLDTIARAKRVLGGLENLYDDVGSDCRELDRLIEAYDTATDELAQARAKRRVEALLRDILECLAAFAGGRVRS